MYLLLLTNPLISFATLILFSRYIGQRGASVTSLFLLSFSLFLAIATFYEVAIMHNVVHIFLGSWILIGSFEVTFLLSFDFLSTALLTTVYIVSFLVHYYSSEYMKGDPHLPRFMAYLSFFTFFMIILTTSGNLLQMFFAWEGVGLCSYLLVSFWFTRTQAVTSSLKAFIYNRVGDLFVISAIALVQLSFYSLEFSNIYLIACSQNKGVSIGENLTGSDFFFFKNIELWSTTTIKWGELVCLFFFLGVMTKSAQIFLHGWLPEAMEGPTPVSALIHAATMVVAGVYLLLRLAPVLNLFPRVLEFIGLIGATTAFFSATAALYQNDIKKIIAYSTCSQLGFMIFTVGLSFYSVCFFHLCSHAFFKALLFLSAGSVIHTISDNQDIRRMGGLSLKMPITYSTFLVASLSLAGLPFLSGFYSKEMILEISYHSPSSISFFAQICGLLSTFLTAAYSFKLIYSIFLAETKLSHRSFFYISEKFGPIINSLLALSLCSICFGFFFKEIFTSFCSENIFYEENKPYNLFTIFDSELKNYFQKSIPLVVTLSGLYFSYFFNLYSFSKNNSRKKIIDFFSKKWYFDAIYSSLLVKPVLIFSYYVLYKILDKGFIEKLIPNFWKIILTYFSKNLIKTQTGNLYYYLCYFIFFIIATFLVFSSIFWFRHSYQLVLQYPLFFLYFFALASVKKPTKNEF